MKKILTILFILITTKTYAQDTVRTTPQFLGGNKSNIIVQAVLNLADSPNASVNWIPEDTATAKTHFQANLKGRWARGLDGRLYFNPTGTKFVLADSVTGGTSTTDSSIFSTVTRLKDTAAVLRSLIGTSGLDTTSISNRIDARVKYTDTATMLSPYYRTVTATAALALKANLASPTFTGTNSNDYVTAKQYSATLQTLTDGATTTWDANSGCQAIWTIGGTGRTLAISNPITGSFYTLKLIQGSGGLKTITTYPTNTKWSGGTAPTLSTAAGSVDIISFWYDGTNYNAMYSLDVK